jgi:hypothetical protein
VANTAMMKFHLPSSTTLQNHYDDDDDVATVSVADPNE